jgi:hypothetical protein
MRNLRRGRKNIENTITNSRMSYTTPVPGPERVSVGWIEMRNETEVNSTSPVLMRRAMKKTEEIWNCECSPSQLI